MGVGDGDARLQVRHEGSDYRWVAVITGHRQRRCWTAGEKAAMVAASAKPGANISEVARRFGVNWGLRYRRLHPVDRRLDDGLRAHVFRDQIGMMAQVIAGAFDLDDAGIVQQTVEERGGDDGGAEDIAPFVRLRRGPPCDLWWGDEGTTLSPDLR